MTETIQRLASALADRYAIEKELGSGGMATVYLARDLRHHREVAIKVLRLDISASLGSERFLREIDIAARLQHPHILPLLDSGGTDGQLFYVMPYVQGESLRDRLIREGELPVHDAVRIAVEIADALGHAHSNGVVHRDIKPENILLSGRHALVADFGVAKAVSEAAGREKLTTAGVALGTPTYMAPEQAVADPHIDHRADLYALGVLLYEMVAGQPPFSGHSGQAILAAHVSMAVEPPEKYRPGLSPALSQLILKCLAKRPADRWQTAEELLAQLEPLATPSGGTTPTTPHVVAAGRKNRSWPLIAAAAVLLAITGVLGYQRLGRSGNRLEIARTDPVTNSPGLEILPAISPDGKLIAYLAGPATNLRLFVRQAAGGQVLPITTEHPVATRVAWSPDGQSLLVSQELTLMIFPALGGPGRPVVRVTEPSYLDGTWSPDGREILYVHKTDGTDSVLRRLVGGGPPRVVATGAWLSTPSWSPDGRFIAYVSGNNQFMFGGSTLGNLSGSQIVVAPADGGAPVPATDGSVLNTSPAWTADSRGLVFVSNRDGHRDLYQISLDGDGRPAGPARRLTTGLNVHSVSISRDGKELAYSTFTSHANVWSIPIPARGSAPFSTATQVTFGNQTIEGMDVSTDGTWLYYDADLGGGSDLYRMPLAGGDPLRLSADAAPDFMPSVSPDGHWLAFYSMRYGTRDIMVMPAEGGEATRVTATADEEYFPRWSPDGRRLAFYRASTDSAIEGLYVVERAGGVWGRAGRIRGGLSFGVWSRDGRTLLASGDGTLWLVPLEGGTPSKAIELPDSLAPWTARWAPDGQTIYLRGSRRSDGMGCFLALVPGGSPRVLVWFDDPLRPSYRPEWSTDGRRFFFAIGDRQADVFVAQLSETSDR